MNLIKLNIDKENLKIMNNRKTATSDIYTVLNDKNIVRDCPGSYYNRTKDISIMILEESKECQEFYLRDIVYLSLNEAFQKYINDNDTKYPNPYEHIYVAHLDILKKRILSQIFFRDVESTLFNKDECFLKYCNGSITKDEKVYLDNTMYFDDHLIDWTLSSDFKLREKAIEIISNASLGSWLVRRSSIREQEHVKIRVITSRLNDKIYNYLVGHINGFGYVLTDGIQGSIMPSLGENKTIKIQIPFYSLPDLLDYMKLQGINMLDMIRK